MPDDQSLWICGIGMMTPVGDCTAQTTASVRAGISRYAESSVYNKRFLPMTMALLPEENLPPLHEELENATPGLTSRQRRMLRLATPALQEALESLPPAPGRKVPLFLATPEKLPDQPDRPPPVTEKFLDQLITQTSTEQIDRPKSKLLPTGRAGGIQAIQDAAQFLAQSDLGYALVGGVDTYLDLYLLGTLDKDDRVLADGVMDGFAPGEGAGFILLCTDKAKESHSPTPTVRVAPPGIASEPGHLYSDEPYKGDGLAEAVTAATEADLNGQQVRTVLCSMNGESLGAKEWGVATLRNTAALDENLRTEHPAECFGDTGAAIGPILLGLAAVGLEQDYLPGPCLVWCASETEHRAAVCVSVGV